MRPLAEALDVTAAVGGKTLVGGVSLALPAGRVVAIVGPNGAGKSSLLRLLSGETTPAGGRLLYGGEPVAAIPPWRLACLRAVLPQSSRLAFPFTVAEVVRMGVEGIGRGLTRAARGAIVASAMAQADVGRLAPRNYQTLSGGEQQRTHLARILAQLEAGRTVAPRQVVLLDEPVAGLDLSHQLALLETARGLAEAGHAVLIVLHDLNLAAAYADEIVAMAGGRVAARGTPREVVDDALMAGVFAVDLRVGALPPPGQPFILPSRRRETPAEPAPSPARRPLQGGLG